MTDDQHSNGLSGFSLASFIASDIYLLKPALRLAARLAAARHITDDTNPTNDA